MNPRKDLSDDNDWLESTLRQWAERPLGDLSNDLHQQVTQRIAKPEARLNHHHIAMSVVALLIGIGLMGWWWTHSRSVESSMNVAVQDGESSRASGTESPVPRPGAEDLADEWLAIQRQVQSLQDQMSLVRMGAELRSTKEQYYEIKSSMVQRERQSTLALNRHQVICAWLVDQKSF